MRCICVIARVCMRRNTRVCVCVHSLALAKIMIMTKESLERFSCVRVHMRQPSACACVRVRLHACVRVRFASPPSAFAFACTMCMSVSVKQRKKLRSCVCVWDDLYYYCHANVNLSEAVYMCSAHTPVCAHKFVHVILCNCA